MRTPTVYRIFAEDRLLYVGCSIQMLGRVAAHRREAQWWKEVTHVAVEHFDTVEDALDAEDRAIASEGPAYNQRRNSKSYQTREAIEAAQRTRQARIQRERAERLPSEREAA